MPKRSEPSSSSWQDLEKRRDTLRQAGVILKSEFVGLDDQIDTVLNAVQSWYLLPETLQRPVVIGLWGRTGVGKTSLVLRLVEILELESRFGFEDLGKFTSADRSAGGGEDLGILEKFLALSDHPSVFLFDEIQTARSISPEGVSIDRPNFRDLWTFLDTGKISRDVRNIENYVFGLADRVKSFPASFVDPVTSAAKTVPTTWDLGFGQWEVDYIRRYLAIPKATMDAALAKDPREFFESALQQFRQKLPKLSVVDFSKSLVFVAGNLDDTFGASRLIDPDLVPPDDLQDATKDLTVNDAKAGLLALFRPEQVARLGSTHVVFHGFSRAQFGDLIDRKLAALSRRLETTLCLRLVFDPTVRELFFDEAVIPSQGARPVISLVGEFIESQIPNWVLGLGPRADAELSVLRLRYDKAKGRLIAEPEGKKAPRFESHPSLTQTQIRKKLDDPILRKVISIHEAGHAVVGMVLSGTLPKRIYCSTLKPVFGGHVEFFEAPLLNRSMGMARLSTLLGGVVAEQHVFGTEELTNGSQEDLRTCTRLVSDLVSQYGMGDHLGLSGAEHADNLTSLKRRDDLLKEEWLKEALKNAQHALMSQPALFKAIANHLATQSNLSGSQLKDLVLKHYSGKKGDAAKLIARKHPLQYEAYTASADRFLK